MSDDLQTTQDPAAQADGEGATAPQTDDGAATPETPVAPETQPEQPTPEAPVAPVVPQSTDALSVNKFSSRLELENAALNLGVDEKKLAAVSDLEELWRLVKNAYIAKHTPVSVSEEGEGEGDLMKVNVKHNGEYYKKGKRYDLSPELKEEFRSKFFI